MHTTKVSVLVLLATAMALPGAFADHGIHEPDGVTAKLTVQTGVDQVLVPDANGNYVFFVRVYRDLENGWEQTALRATLRAFAVDADGQEDVLSQPFQALPTGWTEVTVPASALPGPGTYDIFVTFSELGGNPVPTSHYSAAKNAAIDAGQFDVADQLDYHGTLLVLAA